MSLTFPANVDSTVLQALENETLKCGLSNNAISLKHDKYILLPSIFSFKLIDTSELKFSVSYQALDTPFAPYIYRNFCCICPLNKMASETVEGSNLPARMVD